jgi:membrane-bound hydrogenase subunit beta
VEVVDIPDPRRLFLTENFPENVYPWRKDETGIRADMVKELWAVGRPTDRPAPPVKPKEEKKKEKETTIEKPTEEQKEEEIIAQKATESEEEVKQDE